MELKKKHRNTIVYVDKKNDRHYSYSSTLGSIFLGNSLGYIKEKKDESKWRRYGFLDRYRP